MGNQAQAKAEFDKAKSLVKTTDDALINKLKPQTGDTQASPSPTAGK
jgi:hypothetical protein